MTFTHDSQCQRQLIILQDHSNNSTAQHSSAAEGSNSGTFDALARGNAAASVAVTQCDLAEADIDNGNREALLKKLSRQMGRGESALPAPSIAFCICHRPTSKSPSNAFSDWWLCVLPVFWRPSSIVQTYAAWLPWTCGSLSWTDLAGLHIDEGTAAYYLEQTNGDLKRAFSLYREDLAWETANPIGVLPLREPIPSVE